MRRSAVLLVGWLCLAAPLEAQVSAPPPHPPATDLLRLRDELRLVEAQVTKLRDLERAQSAALEKALAGFLRAEADVVETLRTSDAAIRRAALEKRARLAIEAEMARMKWEKDARAVLTTQQVSDLGALVGGARVSDPLLWQTLVTPLNLAVPMPAPADSGELRISVSPNYADIYVDGEKTGTGRRFLRLPVGSHEVVVSAVGCERKSVRVTIAKQEPTVLSQSLTCTK